MTSIQEVKHKQVYITGKRMGIIQVEAKERRHNKQKET